MQRDIAMLLVFQVFFLVACVHASEISQPSIRRCTVYRIVSVPVPGLDPIPERTVCTNVENLATDQISLDLYGNVERFESGKTVLSIPEDLISKTNEVNADEIHSASVDNSISARGVIYSGAFNMLVLRMSDGSSGSLTYSVNEIGDKVFGAGSIREKFQVCSKNKAILKPAEGSAVNNGVYDVTTSANLSTGDDCMAAGADIASSAVTDGHIDDYDYLMIICPSSTDFQNAASFSFLNGFVSVIKDAFIVSPSIVTHAVGYNFNFRDSGKGVDQYGDPLDSMGSYNKSNSGNKMCFNAAKSYHSNWYTNGLSNPESRAYSGYIIDVNSWYDGKASTQAVAVRVIGYQETSLYFMLHRLDGIASETIASDAGSFVNKVNIVRQANNDSYGNGAQSWHVGSLGIGETYSQPNWGRMGKTLKITVCSIDIGTPTQAKVIAYMDGDDSERCDSVPTASPIMKPTMSPTRQPSISLTKPPSPACAPKQCIDSTATFKIGGNVRDCEWVKTKLRRCNKPRFASHCPVTCNTCDQYKCADSELMFMFPNGSNKICEFVKRKYFKIEKRCSRTNVKSACRETCGYCGNGCK